VAANKPPQVTKKQKTTALRLTISLVQVSPKLRHAALVLFCSIPAAAAENTCATCHPAEVSNYARSAMAHSVSTSANQPDGQLHHERSGSTINITHNPQGVMLQRITEHGLTAEYPVAYAIGAGKVGYSYLISLGDYLFQSPVSYYSQAGIWDVTPGYEPEHTLDFTHPIAEGCVFCHSNSVNLAPGTENRFRRPALSAISCERCHGPTAAHLKNPVPGSIVNPAKLALTARDSICEQCHLEGEARILNPGKHWQDFHAGSDLEATFSTYLLRVSASEGAKAVSHAEQLSLSRCARESVGRLWCGTCHNPHAAPENRAQQVRETCLTCHAALFAQQKHQAAEECVSCHMPRIRPNNVAHAAITNHLISVPRPESKSTAKTLGAELTAWRSPAPALAERNLGLALFQTGSVYRAYQILSHLPDRDPVVQATLGSILLQQNHADYAVRLYTQASAAEPANARYVYLLGTALAAQGKNDAAIAELRLSIQLDPSAPAAYQKLIEIYNKLNQPALSRQVTQDYLKFMPQNISFRQAR
jgi:predicted CXXCH cytochrome family protein